MGLLKRLGRQISSWVSDLAAEPLAQIGVLLLCALWWTLKLPTDILTAGLSILAITLTQMVLNRQKDREAEDHRRDVAMHAKLDELLIATKRARNEMAGIEELEEDQIEVLKEEVKASIDQDNRIADDDKERAAAKRAAEVAVEQTAKVKKSPAPAAASEEKR